MDLPRADLEDFGISSVSLQFLQVTRREFISIRFDSFFTFPRLAYRISPVSLRLLQATRAVKHHSFHFISFHFIILHSFPLIPPGIFMTALITSNMSPSPTLQSDAPPQAAQAAAPAPAQAPFTTTAAASSKVQSSAAVAAAAQSKIPKPQASASASTVSVSPAEVEDDGLGMSPSFASRYDIRYRSFQPLGFGVFVAQSFCVGQLLNPFNLDTEPPTLNPKPTQTAAPQRPLRLLQRPPPQKRPLSQASLRPLPNWRQTWGGATAGEAAGWPTSRGGTRCSP